MRDSMDVGAEADMMETESGGSAAPRPRREVARRVWEYLTMARCFIAEEKPEKALQAMVMAIGIQGGEPAITEFMRQGRELYRSKAQQNAAVDQLASLLGEFAITETAPSQPETSGNASAGPSITPDCQETSILAESGRKQVVVDAFADGSSFICPQCGGLVSMSRKDEHYAYWCSKM